MTNKDVRCVSSDWKRQSPLVGVFSLWYPASCCCCCWSCWLLSAAAAAWWDRWGQTPSPAEPSQTARMPPERPWQDKHSNVAIKILYKGLNSVTEVKTQDQNCSSRNKSIKYGYNSEPFQMGPNMYCLDLNVTLNYKSLCFTHANKKNTQNDYADNNFKLKITTIN